MKKRKTFIPFFLLLTFGFLMLKFSAFPLIVNAEETIPDTVNAQAEKLSSPSENPETDTSEKDVSEDQTEQETSTSVNEEISRNEKTAAARKDAPAQTEKENAFIPDTAESSSLISLYELFKSGGPLMIPISIMSILVVAVGLERFWGLRRGAVLPRKLCRNVDIQISSKADPRAIYALCKKNRSALSRVIQAALFKAGRPMSEVNEVIQNAKEDEANRLYGRVRFLVLAAAVTPLMGLLGTVMGMIQAFMATASSTGVHKAEMLSQGIYLALVTTCAGLIVAMPAAILAHWYEGKMQKLFYRMDHQLVNFVSYLEGLEGKVRFTPSHYRTYVKQKNEK